VIFITEKILFVCKHNCFRSRIAEAYAKQYSHNVSSGGIFAPGGKLLNIQETVIKKLNLKLSEQKPISLTELYNANVVVIVANDVPISLFKDERYGKKRLISWHIPDVFVGCSEEYVEDIIFKIRKKIDKLMKA